MKWLDIEDIVEALEEKFPNENIISIRFTELKKKVLSLEEFDDDAKENRKLSNMPFVDNRTEEQKRNYLINQQRNAYKNRKVKINEKIAIYKAAQEQLTQEQKFELKKLENSRRLINKKLTNLN